MRARHLVLFFVGIALAWSVPNTASAEVVFYAQTDASVQSIVSPVPNSGVGQIFTPVVSGNAKTIAIHTTPNNNGSVDCSRTAQNPYNFNQTNIMQLAILPVDAMSNKPIQNGSYAYFMASSTAPDANGNCFYNFYRTNDLYHDPYNPSPSSGGTLSDATLIAGQIYMVAIDPQILNWRGDSFGGSASGAGSGYFNWIPVPDYDPFSGPNFIPGNVGVSSFFMTISGIPTDPCAVAGACASNVLFLPGIEGSRLYMKDSNGKERNLWEPNTNSDISLLAMTESGVSVNQIYTRDVISNIWGWFTDIYGSFATFMDDLVTAGTIKEWKAYPYDWRYDVFDIVDNGSLKADGSREYLINLVQQMASTSPTGKISIVAHSNGGLVAKALMVRLAQSGKENLVDKIIFVASPEVGTPEAVFTLLHGYNQNYGFGFVANAVTMRTSAKNFPGAYGLLPSAAYFSTVLSPLANFTDGTTVTAYKKLFGATLDSYDELTKFILNIPATRSTPKVDDLATPLPLNKKLVDKAAATHALIDAWRPPTGVAVNEIVGWGNGTVANAIYEDKTTLSCTTGSVICNTKKVLDYRTLPIIDGDGTVLYASAAYLNKATYFNFVELNKGLFTKNYNHGEILSSSVLDSYIQKLLTNSSSTSTSPYFSSTTPIGIGPRLVLVGAHSPVLISATDSAGRTTGIFPSPNPGSDLFITKDEIPNSSVLLSGEGKYLSLPKDVSVTVRLVGTGNGTVTLDTTNADGVVVSKYDNIPVVSGSIVEATLRNDALGAVKLDINGDGIVDIQTNGTPSVAEAFNLLKQRIANISSLVVRNRIIALYRDAERYVKDVRRAGNILAEMEKVVRSQSGRTIPQASADAILVLIQDLKNRR